MPEQFTSSTEGRIYRELGDGGSGFVESFSFTSLAERILSEEGGAAIQTLTDAGRVTLVRRALEELQDNVQFYHRHRHSAAFCQLAAETIDELKSAGVTGEAFARLAEGCGPESRRLGEVALIYEGYETLLQQTGMDPSDRIELAAARLEAAWSEGRVPAFLEGRAVFIDEFDTFNAPKQRLMGAMLAALPQVTVALCDDGQPAPPDGLGLFAGAKAVGARLKQLARKNGAEVAAPLLLREDLRHKDAPGLAALEQLLASGRCEAPAAPAQEIRLFAAPSREEEARAAAGAIRRLMARGVRCGRIAVVCRDLDRYRAAVRYEFRMADIPLWCDEATTPGFQRPGGGRHRPAGAGQGGGLHRAALGPHQDRPDRPDRGTGLRPGKLRLYLVAQSRRVAGGLCQKPPGLRQREADRRGASRPEGRRRGRAFLIGPVEALRSRCRDASAEQISRALWFCLEALGAEQAQQAQVNALRAGPGHPRRRGGRPGVERGDGPAGPDGPAAGRRDGGPGGVRRAVRAAAALLRPGAHPPDPGRGDAGFGGQNAAGRPRLRLCAGGGGRGVPRRAGADGAFDPRRPGRFDAPAGGPARLL